MSPDRSRQQDVTLRQRRQLTLPAQVCEALGLEVGDRLELSVTDNGLVFRPKKAPALQALREIQRAFAQSDVTEEGLQKEGQKARERLSRLQYGER
jgi:AbrB family looped-hinge helix DNA binding protein